MSKTIIDKIDKIEKLIIELNSKIDNFLGYEELTKKEKKEIEKIKEEISKGDYFKFKDVFREK